MNRPRIARRSLRLAAPWLVALIALDAGAAARTPAAAPADIDAVRGCWIQKVEPAGRATLLLRLLPDRERADWLTGQLQRADGDDPDRRLHVMFSRDGRSAALASGPIAPAANRAEGESGPAEAGAAPVKTLRSGQARKPPADLLPGLVHNPGGQVEFVREAGTAAPSRNAASGTRVIDFRERGGGKRLRVEVSPEWLRLSVGGAELRTKAPRTASAVLFEGGRDGCD